MKIPHNDEKQLLNSREQLISKQTGESKAYPLFPSLVIRQYPAIIIRHLLFQLCFLLLLWSINEMWNLKSITPTNLHYFFNLLLAKIKRKLINNLDNIAGYADEAQIREIPLKSSPQSLQIEWTAQSETPITIFRLQFMVCQT